MITSHSRLVLSPTIPALAFAMLFVGSYLTLLGYQFFGGAIVLLSLSGVFYWLLISWYQNPRIALLNVIFLLVIFSPYINYAKEIDGVRYFGSAYGMDFQQYLSVLWSLTKHGIPFKNPYFPSENAVYHYGFLMPLAVMFKITNVSDYFGFFDISNYLFIYQFITSLLFLQFVSVCFFRVDVRKWFAVLTIMFVYSSYKWIFAGILFISSSSRGNFDTSFGFKTPANDVLFGSHYFFSGLFILYLFWYFVNLSRNEDSLHRRFSTVVAYVVAFVLPIINTFSLFLILALFVANLVSLALDVKQFHLVRKLAVQTILLPIVAYVGYVLLVSSGNNQAVTYLTFSFETVPLLVLSLVVNFGPLFYVFLKSGDFRDAQWVVALICILCLLSIMAIFRVSNGVEADDSFNVTRRLGTSMGWLMIVVSNPDVVKGISRWLVYPAALTFFAQYYAFHVYDFKNDNRNERVSATMFDSHVPYFLDDKGWGATSRVSFNFDLIVGNTSCDSPNSLAALRYSPRLIIEKEKLPVSECEQSAKAITFDGHAFTFAK